MAYCRWNHTDCYVYQHVNGYFVCSFCQLMPLDSDNYHKEFITFSRKALMRHIKEHENRAHHTGDTYFQLQKELAAGRNMWRDSR